MSEPPVNVSADGVHPEPRKSGHRLLDFAIALSAIVISLISLTVAIHHGRVQERLVAANSWPFLFWSTSIDQDERGQRFSIYIANSGVGPALLKGLIVRQAQKPVRGWVELLQECCGVERQAEVDPPSLGFFTGGQPKGVIAPAECWKSDLRGLEPTRVRECSAGPDDYVEFGAGIDERGVLPMLKKEQ
jgi:hypothetical protein